MFISIDGIMEETFKNLKPYPTLNQVKKKSVKTAGIKAFLTIFA
jgi:hypothetical protein